MSKYYRFIEADTVLINELANQAMVESTNWARDNPQQNPKFVQLEIFASGTEDAVYVDELSYEKIYKGNVSYKIDEVSEIPKGEGLNFHKVLWIPGVS